MVWYEVIEDLGDGSSATRRFKTSEEAFQAYKTAKEAYIKEVAERWKGKIDDKVYQALLEWKIEITD